MLTKDRIEQFYKDVDSLGLRFPVAEIRRATGYSKGNVSDFLNRKKPIPENFINAFYAAFKSSLNVPREKEPPGTIEVALGIIRDLTSNNTKLVDMLAVKLSSGETGSTSGDIRDEQINTGPVEVLKFSGKMPVKKKA